MFVRTVLLSALFALAAADLPIHCLHGEVKGKWDFHVTETNGDSTQKCTKFEPTSKVTIDLQDADQAVDAKGNKGFWTMIYDEGFEVRMNGHKYFAFNKFEKPAFGKAKSFCAQTMSGYFHTDDGKAWGCYYGKKVLESEEEADAATKELDVGTTLVEEDAPYVPEHEFVAKINDADLGWSAKVYDKFHDKTMGELHRMAGSRQLKETIRDQVRSTALADDEEEEDETFLESLGGAADEDLEETEEDENDAAAAEKAKYGDLPKTFDWRNVDGENYVTEYVRDQGSCGSCFAIATTEMLEARTRIKTKNKIKPRLSAQDIVDCGNRNGGLEYAQACKGGFPYLAAKYVQDFGLQTEKARPYRGMFGSKCEADTKRSGVLVKAKDYKYVGGFYGGCNEVDMMKEIHKNGPVTIGFNAGMDILHYDKGVFLQIDEATTHKVQHVNGWEKTNHAVTCIGWGEDSDGSKFWIAKNSWGSGWGEKGYFRFARGEDTDSFESMAVAAEPELVQEMAEEEYTM